MLARAESFAELTWFADSAVTTAWDSVYYLYGFPSGGCEEHRHSDWTAGQTYQGVAYGYGQNDDTVRYIQKLVQDSLAAGNHMCHYLNYRAETGICPPDWAAGIDCSAFVSRCWGVARTNCQGLYDLSYPVDRDKVQPGDILVDPAHHVVLIADGGTNPPYGTFALYEASGSACRVWYNPSASWSSYSSYYARSRFAPEPPPPPDTLRTDISCEPQIARERVLLRFPNYWTTEEIAFGIFSVTGEKVYEGKVTSTDFQTYWYGRDNLGRRLGSGVYVVRTLQPLPLESQRFIFLQ